MRNLPVVSAHLAIDESRLAEAYARYVERAVNQRLATLDRAELRAHVQRKHDEMRRTFSRCPRWAFAWLPAFAWIALRVEFARSLPLKSFPAFTDGLWRHAPAEPTAAPPSSPVLLILVAWRSLCRSPIVSVSRTLAPSFEEESHGCVPRPS